MDIDEHSLTFSIVLTTVKYAKLEIQIVAFIDPVVESSCEVF